MVDEKFTQWIEELKRVAAEKFEYTQHGINHTDWWIFEPYFLDGYSPEEAMREDLKQY